MMKKINLMLAILGVLIISTQSFAGTIDINTGLDGNNNLAPIGTSDSNWRLIAAPNQTALNLPANVMQSVVGWSQPQAGSQWVSGGNGSTGIYVFERCFCVKNPAKATMELSMRADNRAEIFFNDYTNNILATIQDYSFAPSRQPSQIKVDNGFVPGKNCLRAVIKNDSGPTGFNLVGKVTAIGATETADDCCRESRKLFQTSFERRKGKVF